MMDSCRENRTGHEPGIELQKNLYEDMPCKQQ